MTTATTHRRLPRASRRRTRRGFSLIESVAALVVLGLAVPGLMWAVEGEHANRVNPTLISTARWLAAERLEDIIADRYSTTRGYAWIDEVNYPDEATVADAPAFGRTVTILETGPDLVTPGAGRKVVTVGVSWTDATGTARALTLSSVLAEYQP